MNLEGANRLLREYETEIFEDQREGEFAAYAAVVKKPEVEEGFVVEIGFSDGKPLVVLRYFLNNGKFDTLEEYDLSKELIDFLKENTDAILNIDEKKINQAIIHQKFSFENLIEIDYYLLRNLKKPDLVGLGFNEKIADSVYKGDAYPEYSGKIELLNCGDESRPSITKQELLEGGVSISGKQAPDNLAGTLGCIFKMKDDDDFYLLTNEHVIKGSNCYPPDNRVTHPAVGDKGEEIDIGTVFWKANNQDLDAAIVKLYSCKEICNAIESEEVIKIGNSIRCSNIRFKKIEKAEIGMEVNKCGRTTGLTNNIIKSVNATLYFFDSFSKTHFYKRNQIMTGCMARPGDSGSVMFTNSGSVVGLIYARNLNNTRTFANHLFKIFEQPVNNENCQPKVSFDKFIINSKIK